MKKKVAIIGAGFSGLSAAAILARNGFDTTVYEKNGTPGGRARQFSINGYTFDMGPTWYWMPEVFEKFFNQFELKVSDLYELMRLDPAYRVFYGSDDFIDIPANLERLFEVFENQEKGSSKHLKKFLKDAEHAYNIGIKKVIYKPSKSLTEFLDIDILKGAWKLKVISSLSKVIRKNFHNEKLIRILEFPVLFLGATPQKTPALYSLMNYADLVLGTWYPSGGMFNVVDALEKVAKNNGAIIKYNTLVDEIMVDGKISSGLKIQGQARNFDYIVASADYHHVDHDLLPEKYANYSEKYWDSREMAPSALLFFLGVNKKLDKLLHHNMFFDESFEKHAEEIYTQPQWPEKPSFYVSVASKTDKSCAPDGCENLIILIPVAPALKDDLQQRDRYLQHVLDRIEKLTGERIHDNIVAKRSYSHTDFIRDYFSFKGNAYGLANILSQTAILKPSIRHKKLNNLFYCGQLTVPGPGVPPSLVSGQIVAHEIMKLVR